MVIKLIIVFLLARVVRVALFAIAVFAAYFLVEERMQHGAYPVTGGALGSLFGNYHYQGISSLSESDGLLRSR